MPRAHRSRRGPVRVAASASVVAVVAAALIAGERQPSREVLATSSTSPAGPATAASTAPASPPVTLPDPTRRQVRGPASPADPGPPASPRRVEAIPPVALAAYQRSAAVMDAADTPCGLDWSLLAAIGQVESDHGQVGGSHLNAGGVAHPAIIGPRLDGRHGTSRVRDTDAGRVDHDRRFDRAVGPMQFLPSTWAAVAVDGDGDGRRDVQDINDAALGAAVYLCASHDDLSTRSGQRAALLRYNHSRAYAVRVMAIARDLRLTSLFQPPAGTTVRSISFQEVGPPRPGRDTHTGHTAHGRHEHQQGNAPTAGPHPPHGPVITDPVPSGSPSPDPTPSPTPSPTPAPSPTPTPTPTPTPPTPTDPPEVPVIPDPLPAELEGLTPDQVAEYDAAWSSCDDDLGPGWSADTDVVTALTGCLAEQVQTTTDDPDLVAFVDWLATTQDPAPDPSTDPSTDPAGSPSTDPTAGPTAGTDTSAGGGPTGGPHQGR